MTGVLIDPSGFGRIDSVNFTLRIPYPENSWKFWLEDDRLYGMKLLRYFNFCGRGFTPIDQKTRRFICEAMVEAFKKTECNFMETLQVFFKRKVFRGAILEKHVTKEGSFRGKVLSEMVLSEVIPGGHDGVLTWYKSTLQKAYPEHNLTLHPGLE